MANMVTKTSYPNNPKQIMLADEVMVSFGVVVGNTGVSAGSDGRKILRAGTPIAGKLDERNTAFKKATDVPSSEGNLTVGGEGGTIQLPTAASSDAVGILLHDVDVTNGNANGAIVVFGFVDLEKLDAETFKLITDGVKNALAGKITFLTGSGKKRSEE